MANFTSTPPELIIESASQNQGWQLVCGLQGLDFDINYLEALLARGTCSHLWAATQRASSISNMECTLYTVATIANCCVCMQQAAARQYPLQLFAEMVNAALNSETGEILKYRQLLKSKKYRDVWTYSSAIELVCLAQDISGHTNNPSNIIVFIHKTRCHRSTFGTWRMQSLCATYTHKRRGIIAPTCQLEATASIVQGKWEYHQQICF